MNTTIAQALQWVSISDAARTAGTTPSVLRIWEQRYGWPSPRRSPAGYRRFTPADVELIRQVVARVNVGDSPADIIVDGRPRLLPPAPKPEQVSTDISHLPRPTTTDGIATQRALLIAIARRHPGQIRAAVAECARLRPSERGPAVFLVLAAIREQNPDHAWLDQILEA